MRIGANQRLSDNHNTLDSCGHFAPQVSFMLRAIFLRAFGGKLIEPINELGIAATLLNKTIEPIAAIPATLLTTHAQNVELAGEVAEDDGRHRNGG